ncbi:hypothetical protein [Phormidium sp. CCY1219]|uniref:hypothetical protein n=1 Tax=Phormidium sp. CCY1219 TaxID=2886104 RepID=UPI002D1F6F62|nr:hypothetical protein [Phormidium sp. CCY1219]MEB3827300.1 hypothetical protein [Phormidium sp. CCY1219]
MPGEESVQFRLVIGKFHRTVAKFFGKEKQGYSCLFYSAIAFSTTEGESGVFPGMG